MCTLDLPPCNLETTFSAEVEQAHARKTSSGIVEKNVETKPNSIIIWINIVPWVNFLLSSPLNHEVYCDEHNWGKGTITTKRKLPHLLNSVNKHIFCEMQIEGYKFLCPRFGMGKKNKEDFCLRMIRKCNDRPKLGPLFYLTTTVCHFPPLLPCTCGQSTTQRQYAYKSTLPCSRARLFQWANFSQVSRDSHSV